MSYNRGGGNMRRDTGRRSNDFGSAGNRRGGGGNYGNYSNSNYGSNYNSQMNPWEGGMVPGRGSGGGGGGSSGLSGQGDLLSQLTSPEAQLALASNLINKLITQQQQTAPQLVNLGNMGSGGGHMSSYGDGYGNTRIFQDRRRGRMDQRRTEPYNKSGMNRRMGNDRRNLGRNRMGSDRRSSSFTKSPKVQKEDKDKKDTEKANGEIETKSTDEPKREEDAAEGKEDEVGEKKEDAEKKKQKEKAPPVPPALLYCHICCKNMWDEVSFTKHTKGRPHQLMMDGVNEKYKLKVDLLRHEMRLAEQQREMEIERKQRQGLKMFNHPREYCAMCDLHFHGNLISHRKNIRHQKLKSFLHPKCTHCNKEFSTRLEWDDHRLTFSHLKKVAEYRRATKPHLKDDEFDIEELVNPDNVNCGEMVAKEVPVLTSHPSEEDISMENIKEEPLKERDDVKKEKEEDVKADESVTKEETKEPESQAPQGIDIDPAQLPKYNPSLVIGKDLLVAVSGFVCRVCNRFIPGQEEATVHCRTLTHHTNFCNTVRAKARVSGRRKKQKSKEGKTAGEKSDVEKTEESESPVKVKAEPTTGTDDEGNWKRRKTSETSETENDDSKMDVDVSKNGDDKTVDSSIDISDVKKEDEGEEKEEEEKEEEDTEQEEETETATRQSGRGARGGGRRRGGRRGK